VKWSVPHIGEVMLWLRWPRGFLMLVVTPLAALFAFEVVERARRDSNPQPSDP
jgi:hypothetical protein